MDVASQTGILHEAPAPRSADLALRQVCLTFAFTIGAIVLVYSLWSGIGYRMLMLGMGWPHVILGFVFYFGGVLRGDLRVRAAFGILVLATLAIWTTHYFFDIAALIYIYFLYHAFRDDILVSLWRRAKTGQLSQAFNAAAVVAALLLLALLIAIPHQDVFRSLRDVETTGAQFSKDNCTLFSFDPVPDSRGREFYFNLQAPHTAGLRAFVAQATTQQSRADGELRVNDEKWAGAADLIFQPYYAGDEKNPPAVGPSTSQVPVLLTGGHRVGQTFSAERNNLAGIWLPISPLEGGGETTRFGFHLAAPLFTYPFTMENVRVAAIVLLSALVLWWLLRLRRQGSQLWGYLLVMIAVFVGLQAIFKTSNLAEQTLRYFSQFVLVFHYFLWYVITFDKYRGRLPRSGESRSTGAAISLYDQMLARLRRGPQFAAAVVILNVASMLGVVWYYQLNAPPKLLYFFDYRFFLYFLAFHVTFSFKPDFLRRRA